MEKRCGESPSCWHSARARVYAGLHLRRRVALGEDQWGAEGGVEREFLLRALGSIRQGREQGQRRGQVADGLEIGRACDRALPRPLPVGDGLCGEPRLRVVTGQHLGLRLHEGGKAASSTVAICMMELLARALQQRGVGGLLHEGVLEAVVRIGRLAAAKQSPAPTSCSSASAARARPRGDTAAKSA